jgi:ADP-ribosyl-[dinitrogen reductase] hydrolase
MPMLLEIAVGDAYGAGFEYAHRDFVKAHNDLSGYVRHPRHGISPGCYTDDTQMSMALAEVIVEGLEWTPLNIASRFVEAFKRDPREGYAGGFYHLLRKVKSGKEFLETIRPTSRKSGAAMRASPVGVFPTIQEVIEKCSIQAAVTHNTDDGIGAAVAAALTAHYFLYRLGPKRDLGKFLEDHVPGDWNRPWLGKVKGKGWISVRAAVTAILRNNRLSALLMDCIAFTGDVDTVAAIAMGAAAHSPDIERDLPDHIVRGMENGDYGRDYLVNLDDKLLSGTAAGRPDG